MAKKNCEHELKYNQEGMKYFNVSLDRQGDVQYQEDEFEAVDAGTFYCTECNKEFSEEQAVKILKGE
ncbi:MAG: hypothetical protein Q8P97_02575 [bacterium]|nr:hypothetical protein [bacterium]